MLTKKFGKSGTICQVTFVLPDEIAATARKAHLVGDFNQWDKTATPMKKLKGVFKVTLDLETDRSFAFRYLVNGTDWYNEPAADGVAGNPYGSEDSLVSTYAPPAA